MSNQLSRREFLKQVLPETETVRLSLTVLKWALYGIISYLVIRIVLSVSIETPFLALAIGAGLAVLVGLSFGYRKAKERITENAMTGILAAIETIERFLGICGYMALGIILYRIWLSDPYYAYGYGTAFLITTIMNIYSKKREQDTSLNSRLRRS